MGIPEAREVYAGIYGTESTRVYREAENEEVQDETLTRYLSDRSSVSSPADIALDLVDLPTFSMASAISLGREVASTITSPVKRDTTNMGQMIVFYNESDNCIIDTMYDEDNILTDTDMDQGTPNEELKRNVFLLPGNLKFLNEYQSKLRKKLGRKSVRAMRVPITIPSSQIEVERLLNPPLREMMMTPPTMSRNPMERYEGLHRWLSSHENLKPRYFLTDDRIITSDMVRHLRTDAVYKAAFYASELEGLILLYAHRTLRAISRVIKSSSTNGRYVMFFVDGQAPAIKRIARLRRQRVQEQTEARKRKRAGASIKIDRGASEILFHLCERMIVRIPSQLMIHAIVDIMKIPLVNMIRARGLFLSFANFSEAEDDIVRLVSCLLDLETPTKHFALSKRETVTEYDPLNNTQKQTSWDDVISAIKVHTNREKKKVSVNLYSRDSDVLVKWNLMASHHHHVCMLMDVYPVSPDIKLESCRFFRSRVTPPPDRNSLGGVASRRSPVPSTIYDLSESPLFLSPESTLMIMLMKGSDYNTPLVSDATYDVKIRSEFAMFEKLTCTCISGWTTFLENVPVAENACSGTISPGNLSAMPCRACSKYLVLPFWAAKFYFAAQAVEFVNSAQHVCFPPIAVFNSTSNKYQVHISLAINSAANVMAGLSLGSFNQRIFGSINALERIIESAVPARQISAEPNSGSDLMGSQINLEINADNDELIKMRERKRKRGKLSTKTPQNTRPVSERLSMSVFESIQSFFSKHTEGGIPLQSDECFHSTKQQIFGNVFPTTVDIIDTSVGGSESGALDYEIIFGGIDKSNRIVDPEKKEDAEGDWVAIAERVFSDSTSCSYSRSPDKVYRSTCQPLADTRSLYNREPHKPEGQPQADICLAAVDLPMPQAVLSHNDWQSLAQEFESSLSLLSVTRPEMSILSRMSSMLTDKTATGTVTGVDDPRVMGIPYGVKTMNLLVILYMNMCGLEKAKFAADRGGQLMPQIHEEYCSSIEKKNSGEGPQYRTDCVNFSAAVLEFIFLHYKAKIGPDSDIRQSKRQDWTVVNEKLARLERQASPCISNCKRLWETLSERAESINDNTWICRGGFIPLLGFAISRPWTPLALWSSFIYYYQQRGG
uniref:Wsv139-like protein n=1 Tax=Trachysalambria curvirostris nimavirus TaxID=2984282 RepID=A0A9C7F0U0_9VIRU|nr:MAG: wsv139-like protein [Trachysalambria curvirostris nimavirus]